MLESVPKGLLPRLSGYTEIREKNILGTLPLHQIFIEIFMEEPILKLSSSVRPSLKKSTIIRGTILGGLGVALWLYGGIFLTIETLTIWGWPILLIGGILIVLGLFPYRKLIRLENKPNEIVVTDLEELHFSLQGVPMFNVELENIEEMAFLDDDKRYGIGLWIKNPKTKYITVLHPSLDLNIYLNNCQKDYFCDLFFPFFSKRSYQELEELFKSVK